MISSSLPLHLPILPPMPQPTPLMKHKELLYLSSTFTNKHDILLTRFINMFKTLRAGSHVNLIYL